MIKAIVGLGSNLGDRQNMLSQALERISFANTLVKVSEIYEAYPRRGGRNESFLNCCVEIETDMAPFQLLQFLKETEKQLNSTHAEGENLHRFIDLDLIDYAGRVVRTPELTLPHPDAHRRAFVMIPLAEIKPEWEHPILRAKAKDLAQEAYWDGWGHFFATGKSLLDF